MADYGLDSSDNSVTEMYKCRIQAKGDIITGFCPDHISLSINNSWEAIPGMGGFAGRGGAIIQGLTAAATGAASASQLVKGLSAQVWSGREYLEISIPMHFMFNRDTKREVVDPVKQLLRLASPDESGWLLKPPGPSPVAAGIQNKSDAFITVQIGNYLRFDELIMKGLSTEHQLRFDAQGKATEIQVQLTFSTYYCVTKQYIDRVFI